MAERKFIPQKLKVIITIVNRGKGHFFYDTIEDLGVNLQLLVDGEGTAPYNLDNLWGLAHSERDVIVSFVPEDKVKKTLKVLEDKFETVRNGDGIAFSIPISSVIGVSVYQFLVDDRRRKEAK